MSFTVEQERAPTNSTTGWPELDQPSLASTTSDPVAADCIAFNLALFRLARHLRQENARSDQITLPQFSALTTLELRGEITLGVLSAIERIAPPSMTRITADLAKKGLIVRSPGTRDRRNTRVAISPNGEDFLRRTREGQIALRGLGFCRLNVEDQELLAKALPLIERLASGHL